MKLGPFKHKAEYPRRELSVNGAGFDFHGHLVLPVNGMKVRHSMFVEEHADDDAQESADLRHGAQRNTTDGAIPSLTTMPSSARVVNRDRESAASLLLPERFRRVNA